MEIYCIICVIVLSFFTVFFTYKTRPFCNHVDYGNPALPSEDTLTYVLHENTSKVCGCCIISIYRDLSSDIILEQSKVKELKSAQQFGTWFFIAIIFFCRSLSIIDSFVEDTLLLSFYKILYLISLVLFTFMFQKFPKLRYWKFQENPRELHTEPDISKISSAEDTYSFLTLQRNRLTGHLAYNKYEIEQSLLRSKIYSTIAIFLFGCLCL